MVNEASVEASSTVEASSGSPAEGTICMGMLYFSSTISKKSRNKNPLCFGYSRRVNVIHREDKSSQEVAKHSQALRDFRYACMGRSLYKNNQQDKGSVRKSDLPLCDGVLFFAESSSQSTITSKQGQLRQRNQQNNAGAPVLPRPSDPVGSASEEFGTRFLRSAGKVAAALKHNVIRVGNHVKSVVEDIFHSGSSGSK